MNFDRSALSGAIFVTLELVPGGIEPVAKMSRPCASVPFRRRAAAGFCSWVFGQQCGGRYGWRSTRTGPHGRNRSPWLAITNPAYAPNAAEFDEV
jgi:hypothetical protein